MFGLPVVGLVLLQLISAGAASTSGAAAGNGLNRRSLLAAGGKAKKPLACESNKAASPYRLVYAPNSYMSPLVSYKGEDWVCFRVQLNAGGTSCDPAAQANGTTPSPCCGVDLSKVEIAANPYCDRATTKVLLFKGSKPTVLNKTRIAETIYPVKVEVNKAVDPPAAVVRITKGLAMPQSIMAAVFPDGLPLCLNLAKAANEWGYTEHLCEIPNLFWKDNGLQLQYSITNSATTCCPSEVTPMLYLEVDYFPDRAPQP